MKLNNNEKKLLGLIVNSPKISNTELSKHLKVTAQGIGKIKKNLINKGMINRYETILDYEKIGIRFFVFALVKIMPKAFRKYTEDIKKIFADPHIITLINIPQTSITNIILFGFRDVNEYDNYFKFLQSKLPGLIEIKESYVFSNDSFVKNTASGLFIKMIKEFGQKEVKSPSPPMIEQNK
ncbi:winged helix-turn-helix transcriptional regulator [Candidatus Woesearchaeota archaeon]|nr:winged helix-turn-helix transcriptional regulator [Candidatus Woesearchaeota archaeon]